MTLHPQDSLFQYAKEQPLRFNGSDYVRERDDRRLTGQALKIFELMGDGKWRSLDVISSLTCEPPASISATLRHFRKIRFGNHTVNKKYLGDGLYSYQLKINTL